MVFIPPQQPRLFHSLQQLMLQPRATLPNPSRSQTFLRQLKKVFGHGIYLILDLLGPNHHVKTHTMLELQLHMTRGDLLCRSSSETPLNSETSGSWHSRAVPSRIGCFFSWRAERA